MEQQFNTLPGVLRGVGHVPSNAAGYEARGWAGEAGGGGKVQGSGFRAQGSGLGGYWDLRIPVFSSSPSGLLPPSIGMIFPLSSPNPASDLPATAGFRVARNSEHN